MGRIRLRRVLAIGLVLIIFLSLFASAIGVAALVRNYLWKRGEKESRLVANSVVRFLKNRKGNISQSPLGRNRRPVIRNIQRLNRGPSQLLLLKDGDVVMGAEEGDRDWSPIKDKLRGGLQKVTFEGSQWQVLTLPAESEIADQVTVIRPWSPNQRLVRTLVLYQVVASILVMGLAIGAVTYFSRRLARPLEELREHTKVVGQEGFTELEPSAVVEIAELQASFAAMSERVDEAMASQRRFVADASHELKTPLTAIAGMLELIHDRPEMEEDDRKQALVVARKEATRMQSLIADLLLLSRAQAKRSGARSTINLRELVSEQLETLKVLFPDQEFQFEGDEMVEIQANPGALSKVARNLLENAARYAPGKPIKVVLEQQGEEIRFSVIDQGPGIEEDKLANLFERFYRTDKGRARTGGGHGLGLAIVKALVEEAGGEISCDSKLGEGANFKVTFRAC